MPTSASPLHQHRRQERRSRKSSVRTLLPTHSRNRRTPEKNHNNFRISTLAANIEDATTAFPQWEKDLKESLTDSLYSLTSKLKKVLCDDDRVLDDVARGFLARLDDLRVWRSALCHGAWRGFAVDGSTSLRYFKRGGDGPELLISRLTIDDISSIRVNAITLTLDVVDIVYAAGVRFPGTELPGVDLTEYLREPRD